MAIVGKLGPIKRYAQPGAEILQHLGGVGVRFDLQETLADRGPEKRPIIGRCRPATFEASRDSSSTSIDPLSR